MNFLREKYLSGGVAKNADDDSDDDDDDDDYEDSDDTVKKWKNVIILIKKSISKAISMGQTLMIINEEI